MTTLRRDGDVHVLTLGNGENRFNADFLEAVNAALDAVEQDPAPVVLANEGRIWSNGLDLEWMGTAGEGVGPFLGDVHDLFARVLAFPQATVAAVCGHAFAGGAMLMLACDQAIMRADRGYFCLPEVDIQLPFTPGMNALCASRMPHRTAHDAMTTGRRYGGPDAVAAGIVEAAVAESDVLPQAIARAAALAGKNPAVVAAIKERLHERTLATLRDRALNTPS